MGMKLITTIGFSCLLISWSPAQDLDPGPKAKSIIEKQMVYKTVGESALQVDLFLPLDSADHERRPAIAFFHGGGWVFGEPATFHQAGRRFADRGYVVAVFQYRLSINEDGSYPHSDITPVESTRDARSALRWMKAQAEVLRIDPDRIIASGHSVGGQLSFATALCDEVNEPTDDLSISPRPAALVIFSGTVNTIEAWCDDLLGDRRTEIWSISPYHNLKPGMPPTLGFHGRDDRIVKLFPVFNFIEAVRSHGNQIDYVMLDGGHNLAEPDQTYSGYLNDEMLERVDAFLAAEGLVPGAPHPPRSKPNPTAG